MKNFDCLSKIVVWNKPLASWLKLNIDGSCNGNPSSCRGGGIIKDSNGNLMIAYFKKFENGMNNGAKLRAFINRIWLCKDLGFDNIMIETDSGLVVDCLQKNSCSIWYLWDYWERLEEVLQGMNFTIRHQYREGNQTANFLACQRENKVTKCYFNGDHIPLKF